MIAYKLEITNPDGDSISYTPRRFGEVGKDIVAVKLALGVLLDMGGLIGQNRENQPTRSQPMDPNGWFDCKTGQQISLELAATFDSKMQTSLINYQIKNQFLILSYLFSKYGVGAILNSIGEDYKSESDEELAEYLITVIAQVDSINALFDSELGNLGEATLAVMHGWTPHSIIGTKSYYHSEEIVEESSTLRKVIDILPFVMIEFLISGNLGQSIQDLVEQNIISDGDYSEEEIKGRSVFLSSYLNTVPEEKRWIDEAAPPGFAYGYVAYQINERNKESVLYNATQTTIKNYNQASSNLRETPGVQTTEKLRKVFYPDPFSTDSIFYISEHLSGFYYETDFELNPEGPLPSTNESVIRELEEAALEKVLELSDKPNVWFLPRSDSHTMNVLFGVGDSSIPAHSGILPEAEDSETKEKIKQYIPRFKLIREKIETMKQEIEAIPQGSSGIAGEYNRARHETLVENLNNLEEEYKLDITEEEKIEHVIVLSTTQGNERIQEERNGQANLSTNWRAVEETSTHAPLIKFVEFKTPSMRPGQKYRALMEVNSRKLEIIEHGMYPITEQEEDSTTEGSSSEENNFCINEDTDTTLRMLEEHRVHARRKRREIVRQLRDIFKEEELGPGLKRNVNEASITGGTLGPWSANRALNSLFGFDINGATDYEYTKNVLEALGDGSTYVLEALNILDTDVEYFNDIANTSNKELTKSDASGKPIRDFVSLTVEEFDERVETIVKDLKESSQIIASEGIAFKKGSNFNAQRESALLKQFATQFKELLFESAKESYGQKVSSKMQENPDKTTISIEFTTVKAPGKDAYMGPKFGKKIIGFGLQLPEDYTVGKKFWPFLEKKPSDFTAYAHGEILFLDPNFAKPDQIKKRKEAINKSKVLSRPRTVNYIRNINEMTGLLTDRPNEIISIFDDGRGACKDLGINLDKKLASSYIAKYTTGLQVESPPGDDTGFSWKKFAKENFVDPTKEWINTSGKNWENSWNDSFDEEAALRMLGDMCTMEDLYREFFDKLDLVSLLCDWLKCIRLPNFNLKMPNFYLPPLPTIPILGWYTGMLRFLRDNIIQILTRLGCTFARTIIDKLSIPFCEEQLRDFIAAGSLSGSPLVNQALADSLVNTGIPADYADQAKEFFDDVANITTGEELCHLLAGKTLDSASMAMIERLIQKNDLETVLVTTDDITNYFDLIGTLMPEGICEELQKSKKLPVSKDCVEVADYLQDIRNRLQSGDSTLSDEEIENVIQMAKDEMEKKRQELSAFSGNDIGSLIPQAYGPGNSDAIISEYPDFLKKEIEKTVKNSFSLARQSYVRAMDSYIPSLSIDSPTVPRAGTNIYNEQQTLEFEAALSQLAMYAQGMQTTTQFSRRVALGQLGLSDATQQQLNEIVAKGPILRELCDSAITWITLHEHQTSFFGERDSQWIQGDGRSGDAPLEDLRNIQWEYSTHRGQILLEYADKIRLTSTDGTPEGRSVDDALREVQRENNTPAYFARWGNYHQRMKEHVTRKVPDWMVCANQNDAPTAWHFHEKVQDYRSVNLDDTIEKLKIIIKEYMLKCGHKPDKNTEFQCFAGQYGSDIYPEGEGWYYNIKSARGKEDWDSSEWFWGHSPANNRGANDMWWFHRWSHNCTSDDYRDEEWFGSGFGCDFDSWRYKEFLWYGEGTSWNYTGDDFKQYFLKPGIDSEAEGVKWNDDLRSVEVLKYLRDLTEPDSDPYTATIQGLADSVGVSWYNSLLLYSVFETEEVPLYETRGQTHTVFKRAVLPVIRAQQGETMDTWSSPGNVEFVNYYRRPFGEGTVNDYVDGERHFIYDNPDDLSATFEQAGAIYQGVFNPLSVSNPYPIEAEYVPYDQFYDSFTDPLDKTEYSMIVPSYVATLPGTEQGINQIQFYLSDLGTYNDSVLTSEAELDEANAGLMEDARGVFGVIEAMAESINNDENYAENLENSNEWIEKLRIGIAYAENAVRQIEQQNRTYFSRNLPPNQRPANSNRNWTGQEHYTRIEQMIERYISQGGIIENTNTPKGFVLASIYLKGKEAIIRNPQLAYRILNNFLDTQSGGAYSILDPAQSEGDARIVPVFPVSLTDPALPNENDNWLIHTYEVITKMGIEVLGESVIKEIVDSEGTTSELDDDEQLSADEYFNIFTNYQRAVRLGIRPRFILSAVCNRLDNKVNHPNLVSMVQARIERLTEIVTNAIEFRPNNLSPQHLLLLKQSMSRHGFLFLHPADDPNEDINKPDPRDEIKLKMTFGTYAPEVVYVEHPCSKDYDKYSIKIKSDFHLRQPSAQHSSSFGMHETLPPSVTYRNAPTESQLIQPDNSNSKVYFSKKEAFAQMVKAQIQEQFSAELPRNFKEKLYNDLYYNVRNHLFSKISTNISQSRLFDYDYAEEVDRRLSAAPTFSPGDGCVRNRYGLTESAVLSFNKVIIEETYSEIMKESSKEENSPFNRDFDDPHPLDLAMQSVSIKAYVRVCLIDTLLKGGLAYSQWDIEPIVSEPLFKKYVFEHTHRELKNDMYFSNIWRPIVEKAVGINNPILALKKLIEQEIVKLPDYSKQVFNFDRTNRDYYNWHLTGENVIESNTNDFTLSYEGATFIESFPNAMRQTSSVLRSIEQFEDSDNILMRFEDDLLTKESDLTIEHYVKLSGEIIEKIYDIYIDCKASLSSYMFVRRRDDTRMIDFLVSNAGKLTVNLTGEEYRSYRTAAENLNYFLHNASRFITPIDADPARDNLVSTFAINSGESYVMSPESYDLLIYMMSNALDRDVFTSILEKSTIKHGSRLVMMTKESSIVNALKQSDNIRRNSYLNNSLLGLSVSAQHIDEDSITFLDAAEVAKITLTSYEHTLTLDDCGFPSENMFASSFLYSSRGWYNSRRPIHTDFVKDGLHKNQEFINIVEYIFPLRRYITINSIFATSVLSGYNGLPSLLDSVKMSIGFVAKVAKTPATQQLDLVSIQPEQFESIVMNNWPSHPQSADCIEFPPLPGAAFFRQMFIDLWKLMKKMPSILLRGIANQLDPAYKEMRQHYLNCDIEHLTWDGLAPLSATYDKNKGLVNGLLFEDGIKHGEEAGKYVPILPGLYFDSLASAAHLLKMNARPLGRTIARTVTYAYSGMAPLLDTTMAFQLPCAGINSNYKKGGKYDMGANGRYGHPMTPFTILALSTPQLESDKSLKAPNCEPEGRLARARFDDCEE